MIDTHAHLSDAGFSDDLAQVVERGVDAGVKAVIAVGETLEDAKVNLALADQYSDWIFPAAGLFPTYLDEAQAIELEEWMRGCAERWVAVGEVGLDYWKVQDPEDRELQRQIFRRFVDLAKDLEVPVNVHSRAAAAPTVECLIEWGATQVQLHAFDGRAAKADPAVEAGYFFSVPPSIVRSRQKQKLVQRVPLENLLLETDSPVLGVDPEQRNEPASVKISLVVIAEIKDLPIERVREVLLDNTLRLYGPRVGGSGSAESE